MNLAVFELFPCLLRAKQNETKEMKEKSKLKSANTGRQTELYEQWQNELNVQNVSYFMQFLRRSEKRYSLICFNRN